MKKLFVVLFMLLSLNAYAFDISSIKNVTCKKENTGADNSNSEMYICSYNKNIEFDNAYGDIISLVSKEIISKNKFVSDKSKAKFESTVKDLILKKYEQYVINEKSKDGVILLVSRYDFGNIANIITNISAMLKKIFLTTFNSYTDFPYIKTLVIINTIFFTYIKNQFSP